MKQIQDVTSTYVVIVTIMGIHLQLYDLLQLWGYIYSYMTCYSYGDTFTGI